MMIIKRKISYYPRLGQTIRYSCKRMLASVSSMCLWVSRRVSGLWSFFHNPSKEKKRTHSHEDQIMLSRSILLENSFKEAGIVDDAFAYLTINDSLASAFIVFESEDLQRIPVLDESNCLVGILDKALVVREFTPPRSKIPQRTTFQDKYLARRSCNAIRDVSKETLNDVSHLIRTVKSFHEDELLLYGIRYLLSGNPQLTDELLVLTDSKGNITGTVSGKSILNYLARCIDFDIFGQSVNSVIHEIPLTGNFVNCLADETLEIGLYEISHTVAICILLKENGKLIGMLTREMINQKLHSLHPEILTYSMKMIMHKVHDLDVLQSEVSLVNLCQHLVESRNEFVIVKSLLRSHKHSGKTDRVDHKVISIKSILELLISKILSSDCESVYV